jgi:maltose O-acetyltransferase
MASEREKMCSGELYDASDAELTQCRDRAHDLCFYLGQTAPSKTSERRAICADLFSEVAGQTPHVESPFFCDYGFNIKCPKEEEEAAGGDNSGDLESFYCNAGCVFLDVCPIHVGRGTMFATNVQLLTATHPLDAAERCSGLELGRPISIGTRCWFGGGAIVLPGVTIGDDVVVGAGAVVTKDVPSRTVVVGNPARVIRRLDESENPSEVGKSGLVGESQ